MDSEPTSHEMQGDDSSYCVKNSFEKLLGKFGDFGRYQKRILLLISLPIICSGLHRMALLGTWRGYSTNHRCRLPIEEENATFYVLPDGVDPYMVYPWDEERGSYSPCFRLDVDFTNKSYFESYIPTTKKVDCNGDYVIDLSIHSSSATIDLGMLCDHAHLHELSFKIFRLGIIGPILFGDFADRFGRRPMLLICIVLQVTFGTLAAIVSNFTVFVISRLIVLMTQYGIPLIGLVVALESVGPSKRPFAWLIWELSIVVGAILSDIIYDLITNWQIFQIVLTAPAWLLLLYYWYFPESIRWLLSQGAEQRVEATKMLKNVAKENQVTISQDAYRELNSGGGNEEKYNRKGILTIFRRPRLAIRSLILFLCWFFIGMTEFSVYQNQPYLGRLYDYIYEIAKIVAFIFVMMSLDRFGRKSVLCGTMLAGCSALTLLYFCERLLNYNDYSWLFIAFFSIGKIITVASYGVVYICTAETFPTINRTAGMGCGIACASLGLMTPSLTFLLTTNWIPLLLLVTVGVTISAILVSLGIPETYGQLPEMLEAEDKFVKKKYNSLVEDDNIELDEKSSNFSL